MSFKSLRIVIVCSFSECLLNIYHMPSTVLYAGDINVAKQYLWYQEISLPGENRQGNRWNKSNDKYDNQGRAACCGETERSTQFCIEDDSENDSQRRWVLMMNFLRLIIIMIFFYWASTRSQALGWVQRYHSHFINKVAELQKFK